MICDRRRRSFRNPRSLGRRRSETTTRETAVALNKNRLTISFEFFPPKTAEMEATLWRSIQHLAPLDPAFVSVTYGADGSTRDRTHNIVTRILRETHLTPAAHLTCVGATCAEIDAIARRSWAAGLRHVVP